MDLLSKTLIVAVILVIIVVAAYFAFQKVFAQSAVTEQQAVTLVSNYLASHNPTAVINITNVTPSQYPGSWHIVAAFINYPTSPCPTYVTYSFDYPKYGFVNRTDNIYTENCTIYGFVSGNYTIGSYPVAIVRSYSLKTPIVQAYVSKYGYGSMDVHANYYPTINLYGANYSKVWIVNYSTIDTNMSVYSVISQVNGALIFSYNKTN